MTQVQHNMLSAATKYYGSGILSRKQIKAFADREYPSINPDVSNIQSYTVERSVYNVADALRHEPINSAKKRGKRSSYATASSPRTYAPEPVVSIPASTIREINEATPEVVLGPEKTDEEILEELKERMEHYDTVLADLIYGDSRAIIVSGNPGMGKTHNATEKLEKAKEDGHVTVKFFAGGKITPVQLYILLYQNREPHNILVLDDADSVFEDPTSIGILKIALDTGPKPRTLTYKSSLNLVDKETDEEIPSSFTYKGRMVFLSNINFQREIERNSKISPHIKALVSRPLSVDLYMDTVRSQVIWVRYITESKGLLRTHKEAILTFFTENAENFKDGISIRTIVNLRHYMRMAQGHYERFVSLARAGMFARKNL